MKVKVSNLTGAKLNWAVAKCEGHEIDSLMGGAVWYWLKCSLTGDMEVVDLYNPSIDWAQGGPIIEREKITVSIGHDGVWIAYSMQNYEDRKEYMQAGPTALIAAMRCYVSMRLGNTVDIPEELI